MAKPLRFRRSNERWTEGRVRAELHEALDANLGATMRRPWFSPPEDYDARRFEMDNGDIALFCWTDGRAFWMGNTETPKTLWRTDKYAFEEVPAPVADWAERELLAQLHEESPWLAEYPAVSWFFLPVFLSKDGRHTTRAFFREHAAGFPDADWRAATAFYEEFLSTGALDDHRYVMASKLGTSETIDPGRMAAAMAEFTAAKFLSDAGYDLTPEIEVTTGHSLDFRVDPPGVLVEVTRPSPPARRNADSAVAAVRETAATKTSGQLEAHGGGAVLLVDCSSFPDDEWAAVLAERPDVRHRPAVVYRVRPDGRTEGYRKGTVPFELPLDRPANHSP